MSIHKDLQDTVCQFLEGLESIVNDNMKSDLFYAKVYFSSLTPDELSERIVNKLLPHAEVIDQRDISFFSKNKDILFKGIPADKVDAFESFITGDQIEEDDLEVVWSYFDTIIEIAKAIKKND